MEHIHKTYSCDRCGQAIGSERPDYTQKCDILAQFHWVDAPGPIFAWKDLCIKCRAEVFTFFKPNERQL